MANRTKKPFYFAISQRQIEQSNGFGLLDMLRYDQALVVEQHADFWILSRAESPPTTGRWSSFHMTPFCAEVPGVVTVTRDKYELLSAIDAWVQR
jgi:hypothetical protein